MYNVNGHLKKFYEVHVRLGQQRRQRLAENRDACLRRLKEGLEKLGQVRRQSYGTFVDKRDQGSYAMHTLNQQSKNDYDIDVAVIFEKDDLPTTALEARKRIADALNEIGGGFLRPPEPRTNAVTVWYAEGHHVDLAIYRRSKNWLGSPVLEHAGPAWNQRNPEEVTEWFTKRVKALSPSGPNTEVEPDQLRRIVRLVKAFARSREVWKGNLPGGMIITALVVDVYRKNSLRDDVAFYETLVAMKKRIHSSTDVRNPVNSGTSLTAKQEIAAQVRRFREKIELALEELEILHDPDCTEKDALAAWNWVFRHSFWGDLKADVDSDPIPDSEKEVARLDFEIGISNEKEGTVQRNYNGPVEPLSKGKWLRFRPKDKDSELVRGCELRWTVRNTGDEARASGQERHVKLVQGDYWLQTAYKGVHTMCCEAVRKGVVIARGVRRVRVGQR
ncbi:hypothetical protein NR798_12380 [Archangium gephyra]|uniref:nucleotide-binding domain-containing protein n=1 Tax=Archangium gephyra TaxID=48 RepID=UPI0035D3F34B